MYRNAKQWARIRTRVLKNGESRRHVAMSERMSRNTVRRILQHECPPGYGNQVSQKLASRRVKIAPRREIKSQSIKQSWMEDEDERYDQMKLEMG